MNVNLKLGDVVLYPLDNADSFVVISEPFESISGYDYVRVMYLKDGLVSAEPMDGSMWEDGIFLPVSEP
jgi:hypothetical protein